MNKVPFEVLLGKTIQQIEQTEDTLIFTISPEEIYMMYHKQDCCESVVIEDIYGDLEWLLGSPILRAEERDSDSVNQRKIPQGDCSETWTFYEIATLKGAVTIRWYGYSNGYYSESVDFVKIK